MRVNETINIRRNSIAIAFVSGIILWSSIGFSQEKRFKLIGKVKGIDTGLVKVYSLLNDSTRKSTWSSYISKGGFTIQGKIAHPMRVFLVLNNSLYTEDFFIEPGIGHIYFDATTNESFYKSLNITGSITNDVFKNNYQKLVNPFYNSIDSCYIILDSLNKLYTEARPDNIYANLLNQIGIANKKLDSVKKAFIIKHSSSYVSLWNLYNSIGFSENLEFVVENFYYLDKQLQNSVAGQQLAHRIEVQKVFLNGKKFPEMKLVDSSKNESTIQINGKYTLIDFWYSHCGPCIAQFPAIRNLYSKYKELGFDVISISVDKLADKKDWLGIIAKYNLNWKQYWDVDKQEAKKLIIDTYPTSFLLDSDGKIIKKNILLEELEALLAKNLK